MEQCKALTLKGDQCKIKSMKDCKFCHMHTKKINEGKQIFTIDDKKTETIKKPTKKTKKTKKQQVITNDPPKTQKLDETISYECQCCFDEFSFEDLIKCSNASTLYKHVFCKECVVGYIESKLNDNSSCTACMKDIADEKCGGHYTEQDIKKCLSDEMFVKYENIVEINEANMLAKILPDYKICPFCKKFGIIAENNIQFVLCERCKKSWCVLCNKPDHKGYQCGKILDSSDIDEIRKVVEDTLTNALIHKCAICKCEYIKEEGCNLMTCPSCKSYSCYICGMHIVPKNGTKYWHFYGAKQYPCGEKQCPLFNDYSLNTTLRDQGNAKYNTKKVIDSVKQLLNANTQEVQVTIKNEVKKYGVILESEQIVAPNTSKIKQYKLFKSVNCIIS